MSLLSVTFWLFIVSNSYIDILSFFLLNEQTLSRTPDYTATGTHCAYPERDGQAELTWVAGYIPVCRRSPVQVLTGPGVDKLR